MRVTKNVREYIEREVEKKLMPKYEADKAQAKAQKDALSNFLEGAAKAAEDAFKIYFEAHWNEVGEFCHDNMSNDYCKPHFYNSRVAAITDEHNITSVHCWSARMREEAKHIVSDIIVTLELGGGRAELEEMLNNI